MKAWSTFNSFFNHSTFSSLPVLATTLHPKILAIWQTIEPTLPAAEETSTDDSEEEESGESDEGDEDASENLNAEVKEESLEGEEDEDEDEDEGSEGPNEEHSSSQIDPKNDVIPSISPISEHVGEIKLAEDSHGSVGGEEELPPIEELLKEWS